MQSSHLVDSYGGPPSRPSGGRFRHRFARGPRGRGDIRSVSFGSIEVKDADVLRPMVSRHRPNKSTRTARGRWSMRHRFPQWRACLGLNRAAERGGQHAEPEGGSDSSPSEHTELPNSPAFGVSKHGCMAATVRWFQWNTVIHSSGTSGG